MPALPKASSSVLFCVEDFEDPDLPDMVSGTVEDIDVALDVLRSFVPLQARNFDHE